jgi:hypothetical protein
MNLQLTIQSVAATIYGILLLSVSTLACQPIVQFIFVFGGGTAVAARSLWGLTIGVFMKCFLFALLEKKLSGLKAFRLMFLGNLFSGVIGLFLGIVMSAFAFIGIFILLIVIGFIANGPAKRISKLELPRFPKMTPRWIQATLMFLCCATVILFFMSANADANGNMLAYWALKLAYIYPGLLFSIITTSIWEESIIYRLSGKTEKTFHFFPAVIRANLITLTVLMIYAAAITIPERLASPYFLKYK